MTMKIIFLFFLSLSLFLKGQVVINEIMVNPSGPNDGSNMPNTAEWIELYNAGSSAVNISCWVLADGDMTITIPSVTSIPSHGFFTLASASGSGLTPNLDFSTCSCGTPASQLVIFTNGNEQLVLTNAAGVIQDAVIWGATSPGGQSLPDATNPTIAVGVCGVRNISLPVETDPIYEYIGNQNVDGVASKRDFDGSSTWVPSFPSSFGTTNGSSTLPIELLDFYGTKNGSHNDVTWKVALERNINYYTIEKSNDALDFVELTSVYTNNEGYKTYSIVDENPFSDITYYRLNTKEQNGETFHQQIISVDNKDTKWQYITFNVNDELHIDFKTNLPKQSSISLFDITGKLMLRQNVVASQNFINTDNLAKGLYFVQITTPYKTENFKVVIP